MKKFITFIILISISFSTSAPFIGLRMIDKVYALEGGDVIPSDPRISAPSTPNSAVSIAACRRGVMPRFDESGRPSCYIAGGIGELPTDKINITECASGEQPKYTNNVPSCYSKTAAQSIQGGNEQTSACGKGVEWNNPLTWINGMICQLIFFVFLKFAGSGLYITAKSFDLIVNLSLFEINNALAERGSGGIIYTMWSWVRNLCNMVGIFLFIVSAFYIIIGKGLETRKYIVKLLIFAILLNFSFPISKAVLDFSNIFALNIYGMITSGNGTTYNYRNNPAQTGVLLDDYGLSFELMQVIGMQNAVTRASNIDKSTSVMPGVDGTLSMLFVVIMVIALAIVFAQAAMLFATRTLMMILAIITSPIMFMGGILPPNQFINLDDYVYSWTKRFFGGAFMAPVLMINMWLAMGIMKFSVGLSGGNFSNGGSVAVDSAAQLICMCLAIIAFQKSVEYSAKMVDGIGEKAAALGGKLGAKMMNAGGRAGGFLTRSTVGRGASRIMDRASKEGGWLQKTKAAGGFRGMAAGLALKNIDSLNTRTKSSTMNAMGLIGKGVEKASLGKLGGLMSNAGDSINRDNEAASMAKNKFGQVKNEFNANKLEKAAIQADLQSSELSNRSAELSKMASDTDIEKNNIISNLKVQESDTKNELLKLKQKEDSILSRRDANRNLISARLLELNTRKNNLNQMLAIAKQNNDSKKIDELSKEIKQSEIDIDDYKGNVGLLDIEKQSSELLSSLASAKDKGEKEILGLQERKDIMNKNSKEMAQKSQELSNKSGSDITKSQMARGDAAAAGAAFESARKAYKEKYANADAEVAAANDISAAAKELVQSVGQIHEYKQPSTDHGDEMISIREVARILGEKAKGKSGAKAGSNKPSAPKPESNQGTAGANNGSGATPASGASTH